MAISQWLPAQSSTEESDYVQKNFAKMERMIPMRDGVRLFTSIYVPINGSERYPILMERTPYSCAPYGETRFKRRLGPNSTLMKEKYIFVYQDVRGRYKSEGHFEEMTPAIDRKASVTQTDESSDTYDTIEWLLTNITNNNGKVGIFGISYPGFYATASLPNAHPAIRAVSPQAPVTDEFIGDDANHNGAFFLLDNFDFTNYFQGVRTDSGTGYKNAFTANYSDAYRFFLDLGPLKNTNDSRYFGGKAKIWNEYLEHDTYDSYWQARNIRPHLQNIKPAVLVVGGWFDAEDLFGSLRTYEAIIQQSPSTDCRLVMGPWTHGAWSARDWSHFDEYTFGENLNVYFQSIETSFFNFYLKGKGDFHQPKATIFETGANRWDYFSSWPPPGVRVLKYYFRDNRGLYPEPSGQDSAFDEYESDPRNPVPYTKGVWRGRNNAYMVEDQRFASSRTDVLVFQSRPLEADLTVCGRPYADIYLSSSGNDADLIVKLIDVDQDSTEQNRNIPKTKNAEVGPERLVRAEVFRCKFRSSFVHPEPLVPDRPTRVVVTLNDINHTFKKGHRIMVQVQSSWFPLVDINPQTFVSIPQCGEADFKSAKIRIYRSRTLASSISLPTVPSRL